MAFNYIPDALLSLQKSIHVLQDVEFKSTRSLTRAVLATEDEFETLLIRDAAPYELSLFTPTSETKLDTPLVDVDLSRLGDDKWTATKRAGPQRVANKHYNNKPSPLKRATKPGTTDDPAACLEAARKLLQVYPMTRANEHVQALSEQYQGILSTIAELEDTLKKPVSRTNLKPHQQEHFRALDLEEQIKREQMEIFALEQLQVEKQAEIDALSAKPRPRKPNPSADKSAGTTRDAPDPFAKSTLLESKAAAKATTSNIPKARQSLSSPRRPVQQQQRSSPATTPRTSRSTSAATVSNKPSPASSATTAPSPGDKLASKTTTTPRKTAAPIETRSTESTPKAGPSRLSPVKASSTIVRKKANLPISGVTEDDLDLFANRVWNGLGDILRPWARKTLSTAGQDVPSSLKTLPFEQTYATLQTVLSSPPAPVEPSSPQSIVSSTFTSDAGGADNDPSPPNPSTLLEVELLNLLFTVISGRQLSPFGEVLQKDLPALSVTLRDPVLVSSLNTTTTASPTRSLTNKKDPMISMNNLKLWLSAFAASKGLQTDMATTSIYSLVSKNVLRIDRRSKEGPMVGFRY
ncbi:hypothetical protein OIO90_002982 [Microbotryomycetes sp. JL221]|nr:hypothetical protein OIO90_002982 [Microbotryomycetes sp. JL221]